MNFVVSFYFNIGGEGNKCKILIRMCLKEKLMCLSKLCF